MSDQINGNLSDKDKIDRAAQHEELQFIPAPHSRQSGDATNRLELNFKLRMAERHRARLESEARAPQPCLEAVHSRFRAAQGGFDSLTAPDD